LISAAEGAFGPVRNFKRIVGATFISVHTITARTQSIAFVNVMAITRRRFFRKVAVGTRGESKKRNL